MIRARGVLLALAVVSGGALAGCGGPPASMSDQIHSWSVGAGYADLDSALVADFPAVSAGLRHGDLKALHTACSGLSIDAGSVYAVLVTPNRNLTNNMATSLQALADDGGRCGALTTTALSRTAALRASLAKNEAIYKRARAYIYAHGG